MHTFLWYIHIRRHASSPHLLHDALRDDDNNNNAHPHRRGRAFITDISRGTWAITCARFLCIVTRYNVAHTYNECTWSHHGAESNAQQHLLLILERGSTFLERFTSGILFPSFLCKICCTHSWERGFFFLLFRYSHLIPYLFLFPASWEFSTETENLRSSDCGNGLIIFQ